ncbi:MAG: hypothetical protein ACO1PZ_09490 [Gammaproteobacteria bacterium]
MKKIAGIFVLVAALMQPLPGSAQPAACVDDAVLDELLAFGDLFLGEVHGTIETPQLVRCLVERALENATEPVIVSLELSELARDPGSPLWRFEEGREGGRTSQAMYALVQDFVDKEQQGRIELHFQFGIGGRGSAESIGLDLKALAERGRVIAYAGNAHSMKNVPPEVGDFPLQEGGYVGPAFTLVDIRNANGGTFWACMQARCGIQQSTSRADAANVLVDGSSRGHDYVLYLERFTASPPMDIASQ